VISDIKISKEGLMAAGDRQYYIGTIHLDKRNERLVVEVHHGIADKSGNADYRGHNVPMSWADAGKALGEKDLELLERVLKKLGAAAVAGTGELLKDAIAV
jgi:hypothetical protein